MENKNVLNEEKSWKKEKFGRKVRILWMGEKVFCSNEENRKVGSELGKEEWCNYKLMDQICFIARKSIPEAVK